MATSGFIFYDPRGHTFMSWASLICELYASQNIQVPTEATNWKDWADGLKAIDVFTNEAIPDSRGFSNWQDWADAMIGAVNAGK